MGYFLHESSNDPLLRSYAIAAHNWQPVILVQRFEGDERYYASTLSIAISRHRRRRSKINQNKSLSFRPCVIRRKSALGLLIRSLLERRIGVMPGLIGARQWTHEDLRPDFIVQLVNGLLQ